MMIHTLLNSIGLAINIIGSLIILKFGLPNRIDPEGHIHLILEQVDQNEIGRANTYKKRSTWGLIGLIGGFALQLVSNFIPQ